jgi:hypothetical protein
MGFPMPWIRRSGIFYRTRGYEKSPSIAGFVDNQDPALPFAEGEGSNCGLQNKKTRSLAGLS